MGGSRKISTAVRFSCVVFVASPFQTIRPGFSSFIFFTTGWKESQRAWVSFITAKWVFAAAPGVVKAWTFPTTGAPSFAS